MDKFIFIVLLTLLISCNSTTPQWQIKIGNRGDSRIDAPVTASEGLIYVAAGDQAPGLYPWGSAHYLQALSLKDGGFRWHANLGGSGATTPVVDDETVYIVSLNSGLYALDTTKGQLKWFFPEIGSQASIPVVSNGIIYVSIEWRNHYNRLLAIDTESGQLLWSASLIHTTDPTLAPLVTTSAVYFVDGPELYIADPQRGNKRLILKMEEADFFVTEPVIQGEYIYVCSNRSLMAINAGTEALQWKFPVDEGFISSLLISNNVAYFSSIIDFNPESVGRGKIVAVDLKTQSELWHFNFNRPIFTLIDDNDTIYFGSGSKMRGVDKATGKEIWRFEAETMLNSPFLVDGMIYVGDWDGQLYAIPAAEKSQ